MGTESRGGPPDGHEARRQEAILEYGVLDDNHPSRAELRSLVALAAAAIGVPRAAINLLTEDEQHLIEAVGFETSVSPRSDSLCSVFVDEPEPVVLTDASQDERFRDSVWVRGPQPIRFYAAFQLRTPAKVAIGNLCLYDSSPRTISEDDRRLMTVLAARVSDVLELELQARRWQATVRELERTNARLVDFAATVSHDLRGPLSTVEMALEILADQLEEDAGPGPAASFGTRDLLARARRSTQRMSSTIAHLLAESRLSDTDRVRPTSWRRVAADALEDLGREVADMTVTLDPTDALVCCRPVGLRLALQNILANATRYAGSTDPRVEVGCRPLDGGHEITVVDHGPGVPAADRHRIFASRDRGGDAGAAARPGDDEGHGLGLATAYRLVAEMGGRIEVRDTPGGGATFAVWLPAPDEQ